MDLGLPAITVIRGDATGPIVGVLGGVHGDEYEGVLAASALASRLPTELVRGEVRLAAPAHPAAWTARSRRSPIDGADLARSFPGRSDGAATQRVADAITEQVIRGSDLIIDLHSGGSDFAMAFLCGYQDSGHQAAASRRYADAFAARFTWRHAGPPAPGRSLSAAAELGIPAIYVEGRGGRSIRSSELQGYADGLRRVLRELGMVPDAPAARHLPVRVHGDGNTDAGITAPIAGYLVTDRDVGDDVGRGDPVAGIVDANGNTIGDVLAPTDGYVMLLRRDAQVSSGDTVCIVAGIEEQP